MDSIPGISEYMVVGDKNVGDNFFRNLSHFGVKHGSR